MRAACARRRHAYVRVGRQLRGGLAEPVGVSCRCADDCHGEFGVWDTVGGTEDGYTGGVCHLGVLDDAREFDAKLDCDPELLRALKARGWIEKELARQKA